jgi:hypothetical protein
MDTKNGGDNKGWRVPSIRTGDLFNVYKVRSHICACHGYRYKYIKANTLKSANARSINSVIASHLRRFLFRGFIKEKAGANVKAHLVLARINNLINRCQ